MQGAICVLPTECNLFHTILGTISNYLPEQPDRLAFMKGTQCILLQLMTCVTVVFLYQYYVQHCAFALSK
jgi:hypothetical protein